MTTQELKILLKSQFQNNTSLIKSGVNPICYNIEGPHGIGKTSIVRTICKDLNYQFRQINLGQLSDLDALIGFPYQKIQMTNEDSTIMVRQQEIEHLLKAGYKVTGVSETCHAEPEWVAGMQEGPGVLFLDDYTRALPFLMQATMTLIEELGYYGWKLPKGWMIVLSTNPEGGEYSVASLDPAQQTRFTTLTVTFSMDEWLNWAESQNFDPRVLTFVESNKTILAPVKSDEVGIQTDMQLLCARSMTNFFRAIQSIGDYAENLSIIQQLATGTVGRYFSSEFSSFVLSGLYKLPSAEEILSATPAGRKEIFDSIRSGSLSHLGNRSAASILAYRLTTFILYSEHCTPDLVKAWINTVLDTFFTNDLLVYQVRRVSIEMKNSPNYRMLTTIMTDPRITAVIVDSGKIN